MQAIHSPPPGKEQLADSGEDVLGSSARLSRQGTSVLVHFVGDDVGSPKVVQVLGIVAPLLHHGLLDTAGVALGVNANLLGNLDTVGLGHQSEKK